MARLKWVAAITALLAISGCSESYEDQTAALEKFTQKTRVGTSADVWLMKHNFFGEWEKVTLVFGFTDDFDFCQEIADLYMGKYPTDRYSCFLAN